VLVVLDDFTISANPKYAKERNITQYTVCLAYQKSETVWDKAACARPVKYKVKLLSGQSITIESPSLTIPIKGLPPIHYFWLVLEIQETLTKRRIGYGYARTSKNVFAQPSP